MGTSIAIRVQKHRKALRDAGLKPVQLWLPDIKSERFRAQCKADSMALVNDPQEKEILEWIEQVADTTGWK